MQKAILQALHTYDPYGHFQVVGAQTAFTVICLFLVNFVYAIPEFNKIILMPAWGFVAIGRQQGFSNRLQKMAIFSLITVLYACLLISVQAYKYLSVMTVGVVIFYLYFLSKKYSFLLTMIPFIQLVAYAFLTVPFAGNGQALFVFLLNMIAITLCTLVFLYAFPRIYFFRVWLRAWQATLLEFSEKITKIIAGEAHLSHQQVTVHLAPMEQYARSLSHQEFGFAARKMSLRCIHLYTFIIAVIYKVQPVHTDVLEEVSLFCKELARHISLYQPIEYVALVPSVHPEIRRLHKKMQGMAREWNRLCQRL